jgi:branched-chain amino acid transport system substrate-binding protein
MKNYQKIGLVIGLLIIIAIIIYTNVHKKPAPGTTEPIKIGFVLPLTGAYASYGEEFRRGAEVALDEITDQKPEIIFEDGALEVNKTVNAITKLVQKDTVDALVATSYADAAAGHQITDAKQIPMLILWDSNKQLEDMGDYVFASGPWTPASGEVSATFASKDLGAKTAAIFGYKQEWSVAVSESFESQFKKEGGEVVYKSFSTPGVSDYRTELFKIKNLNPAVVYMTTENMYAGVKQLREAGYTGSIITSDVLDDELVKKDPALFEGVYESLVVDPAVKKTDHYVNLYKKKFGMDPKKVLYGTWGYDAVWILYHASANQTSLKDGLYATQNYAGASGTISFTPEGSSKTIPVMVVAKKGKIERVK